MTETMYAIDIYKSTNKDEGYQATHLTIDLGKTLCGENIDFNWVEVNHEKVTCIKCLDRIPAGLREADTEERYWQEEAETIIE